MIQRYKRLSIGSSDPENVKKYEERLRYWEGRKDELEAAETVDSGVESGIISTDIDELVPCLRDNRTGEIVETDVEEIINFDRLKDCNRRNGWDFPWNKPPKGSKVFALHVKGSDDIEGLIALKNHPESCSTYMC